MFTAEEQVEVLHSLADSLTDLAQAAFEKVGEVMPTMFFVEYKDVMEDGKKFALHTIPMPFQNVDQKALFADVAKSYAKTIKKLVGAVFLTEAWTVTRPIGKSDLNVTPSEEPDRREVVMISMKSADYSETRIFPIVRHEANVSLGEMEKLNVHTEFDRFFDGLFLATKVLH